MYNGWIKCKILVYCDVCRPWFTGWVGLLCFAGCGFDGLGLIVINNQWIDANKTQPTCERYKENKMKLDYDLIEKIGATHYNQSGCFVVYYKVDGNCVEFYHDTAQKMIKSVDSAEYLINNLKPIPPRPKLEYEFIKANYGKASSAVMDLESGVKLYYLGEDEKHHQVKDAEKVCKHLRLDGLYTRREVTKNWAQKVADELRWGDDLIYPVDKSYLEVSGGFTEDEAVELAKAILKASGQ